MTRANGGRERGPFTEIRENAKRGQQILVIMGVAVFLGFPVSSSFGSDGITDSEASRGVAESAMDREVAELVKFYPMSLQKHEDNPMQAKDNCGLYKDAIREFSPTNLRIIVSELLDGLRENCEKGGNRRDKES